MKAPHYITVCYVVVSRLFFTYTCATSFVDNYSQATRRADRRMSDEEVVDSETSSTPLLHEKESKRVRR